MKPITLPIAELKPALVGIAKVINKHGMPPIRSAVKIERTREGWITLTGTDLDNFVTVRLEQPTDGELVSFVLAYDDLLKTANKCSKDDAISVRSQGNSSGTSVILNYPVGKQFAEHRCVSFPVQEFPPTPRVKGEPVPVDDHLQQVIHEAMDCASVDPTRFVLNGVYVDVSDKRCNHVVATDGSHLYASNSFSLLLEDSILIPNHRFLGWKGFKTDGEWQLRVNLDDSDAKKSLLQISSRRWRFITSQIEGDFPNWRHVVPSEFKTIIHLYGEVLDSAVEIIGRIPYDAKDPKKPICLRVDGKKLIVRGRNKDDEKWTEIEVPGAKITGSSVNIYLNRDFAVKALKFGLTQIEIQDEMSPMQFVNGGKQMIVMPVKVDASSQSTSPSAPAVKPEPRQETHTPQSVEINERRNMVNNTAPTEPEPASAKPALETAIEQVETLKELLKGNLVSATAILGSLKIAQREQKVTEREYRSIKSTLRSLQSVRI